MREVLTYYDYLHTIPEEGFKEIKTSKFLADKLESFGYKVTRNLDGKTGICGVWDSGVPGPVVAIRADMDALGHVIDGVRCSRHTCGHDAHSAVVLTTAHQLKENNLLKKGKLKIIFQPAEELGSGALSIAHSGVIDDVDYIFGSHLRPFEEAKDGEASPAIYYSASARGQVTFHGTPAHGARPHLGVNAIDAAVAAINAVNAIHLKPTDNYSIKATRFICDSGVTNAIPAEAHVTWDIRAQYNTTIHELIEKFKTAVIAGAATVGATATIDTSTWVPAPELNDEATKILRHAIVKVLGEKGLKDPIYTPGGEDFSQYPIYKPSIKAGFFGLGCDLQPGLHHPDMHFNKNSLDNGVAIFVAAVTELIG